VAERSHLSIGEVLSLLRDEFPDVTISKIRFLESQGLVDPERTPSGYRKFYDHDVERLRWILRQQREHFLPLKVIRGRLSEQENGAPPAEGPLTSEEAASTTEEDFDEGAPSQPAATAASGSPTAARPLAGKTSSAGDGRTRPAVPSLFAPLHDQPQGGPGGSDPGESKPRRSEAATAETGTGSARSQARPAETTLVEARPGEPRGSGHPSRSGGTSGIDEPDSYTAEELAGAAGAETTFVLDLKQYGLLTPHAMVAGVAYFDHAALAVTRAAAEFARHGVEARHLRVWRNSADREADLFQQVVLPLLRQRNPQARRQALDTLAELSAAGAALRAALVDRAVREIR
jgi:DNA-binding transcriptional MerR regulator